MKCARGCCLRNRHRSDCPDPEMCGGCLPRQASVGVLCEADYLRLESALRELPGQWHQLASRLRPDRQGGQVRVAGTPERQLPIDPRVAEHRQDITRLLVSWAMLASETLNVPHPRGTCVDVTARWLDLHLQKAAAHEWATDLHDEITALNRRARNLLHPTGRRRITLGTCPETDCAGTLTASVARTDDLLPSEITCDADVDHAWPASEWLRLGRRIHKEAA